MTISSDSDPDVAYRPRAERDVLFPAPDVATCPDCLAETLNPQDRRFRYPFTNCANCGPRYTIIREMPYDRAATSMREFRICPECQAEVDDPARRRYRAQANGCSFCGPQIELIATPEMLDGLAGLMDDVARAAALIKRGYIVAIKGPGGFHLACDATNAETVARLRERKSRPDKPLAVMMATLDEINQHCPVSAQEAGLLQDPSAPIALLYRRPESKIAANVAPNNPMLGVMLPPTPLYHLLARDLNRPMVMTSANLTDLPVIVDNDLAQDKLAGIADAFVLHNLSIETRVDDSVWWIDHFAGPDDSARLPLRLSRGDAPRLIRLPWRAEKAILAVGADMNNTLCLMRDNDAVLSQHVGEASALETLDAFRATFERLSQLSAIVPQVIAHDLNPGYRTTRMARLLAEDPDHGLVGVQHHHAHIVACLAEHGHDASVIGIVLDGTGYGDDGAAWGGEVLVASLSSFERVAHLEYLPLTGGDATLHKPYRIAWGYLHAALGNIPDLKPLARFPADERRIVAQQIDRGQNTPMTSSCGRLFDAVAALIGVCPVTTHESQAAVAVEQAARRVDIEAANPYPFALTDDGIIRLGDTLSAIVKDMTGGRNPHLVAAAFHHTLAMMFVAAAKQARQRTGIKTVALSGGCFQNRVLLRLMRQALHDEGFEVLTHRQVPANDGGLSLGQAVVALRHAADFV